MFFIFTGCKVFSIFLGIEPLSRNPPLCISLDAGSLLRSGRGDKIEEIPKQVNSMILTSERHLPESLPDFLGFSKPLRIGFRAGLMGKSNLALTVLHSVNVVKG